MLYFLVVFISHFFYKSMVFRWLFIPWLQTELDAFADRLNNTKKRADRNKILLHGVPNDIHESPERYGCLDFKVLNCVLN